GHVPRPVQAPRSGRPRAVGTPPQPRGRHAPAPGRPSAPAPRRPAHQVPPPPLPDATHDDPDQLPGQSPPPTPNGPTGDPAPPLIDRRRSAPADAGMSPALQWPAAPPLPRLVRPQGRGRAARLRAAAGTDLRPAPRPPSATGA